MAFNEKLPEWQEPGIEPPESKRKTGWQINDKPPAAWLNWYFNRVYKVFQEIRSKFDTHTEDNNLHVTAAKQTAWNAKETPEGAQTKADAAREAAKAASTPLAQKGVAGGVAALDATKLMLSDGTILASRVVERVFNFSFANGVANQKIDVIFPVNGGLYEIEVIGSFNTVNTAGKLVKRFNGTYSNPASYPTGSQYTEVTGVLKNHISIGEPFFDSDLKWRVTLESRTTAPNPFTVIARVASGGGMGAAPTLSAVYTGTATTLPVAVQAIPDDTVTQSGYLVQKHKLTENDGKVIRLAPNTDLNTVNRNGQYDGYPLVNAPGGNTGAWFFIEVFSHSQNPDTIFFQRATTFATVPRTHIRECYNSVWGAWIEIEATDRKNVASGYAGLGSDAKLMDPQIPLYLARKAGTLADATDLNSLGEGEYCCPSNASAATMLNLPAAVTGQSFFLKVTKHAGFNQTLTTYVAGVNMRVFTRNIYNGVISEWYEQEHSGKKNVANGYAGLDGIGKVARILSYSSLGATGGVSNLDSAYTAGTYSVSTGIPGSPSPTEYGQVLIHLSAGETHDSSTNWIWQMFFGTQGNTYVRRKVNNGAWQPWVPMWTGYNDSALLVTRSAIANGTDFNSLTTNGVYAMSQATGLLNPPPNVSFGVVIVSRTDGSSPFVKQEATDVTTGNTQTRFRNGSNVWTPWVANITSGGVGVLEAPLTRRYTGTSYKYTSVASYYQGAQATGTIKITLPVAWTLAMMRIKISGYDYKTPGGAWELTLGGYNFTNGWAHTSAFAEGILPFSSVRFAFDGTKCCILLGGVTTVWNFPSIEVSEVLASHGGASGLGGAWVISLITSETGITNIVTPELNQVGSNASTLGGYSAAQVTQGTLAYAVTTGTAPTLVATFNPAVAALSAGLRVTIKAHAATTGPVTLNVNGLGAKSIKKPNGNNPPLALGGVYTVVYDGTAFILQGEGGEYGTATAAEVLAGKTIGTDNGLVNGTMPDRTRAGDSLTYTTALSAKGDGFGSLVMEPQTGYYASGLNSGGFGTLLSVDPNYVPASILSTKTVFGVQGSVPVISGVDDATGVGRWGNGDLAVYPREGYRKGGSGAGEIKVSVAQLASVSYVKRVTGSTTAYGAMTSKNVMSNTYTFPYVTVTGLDFRPTNVRAWHDAYPDTWCVLTATKLTWTDSFPITWRHSTSGMNPEIFFSNDGFQLTINVAKGATVVWEAW